MSQEVQKVPTGGDRSQGAGNGYPYCTNGSNNGDGYGYDPAVVDPKGSNSCVVRGGPADSGSQPIQKSQTNTDARQGANAANGFPYCTNGSNSGGGFGYDESVVDPTGSHSCIVPGGSADTGSGATIQKASNGYPYCTNGSNNGDGYGYDESVVDPRGSHSCVAQGS